MSTKTISQVRFLTVRCSDSIARPSNTTAYAAGDVISEITTNDHFTFTGIANVGVYTGTLDAARCFSSANKSTLPDLELWLFHTDIAEVADNAAFAPTDAEMLTLVGIVDFPVASWKIGNPAADTGNVVCEVRNIGLPFRLAGSASAPYLYGQLVVRNAYTPVASEVFTVELNLYQD